MIKKIIYISAAIILLFLAISHFMSKKSWVIKFYVDNGEKQSRTLIYIMDHNMKIVTKDRSYLYNSETKNICFINPKENIYWSGKIKDFSKAVIKTKLQNDNDFIINDVSFLRNMNSINRKYFEEMINRRTGKNPLIPDYSIYTNFNIKSTPNFTSVGDYAVRKYEVLNSEKVVEEIWIAENILIHMGWDMNDFKEFLEAFFLHANIVPYFNLDTYMKVRKNGLPMKVIIFHNKEKCVITMDHASKTKLNERLFSIPENLKSKPIEELLKVNF